MNADWTAKDGRSNASPEFVFLSQRVGMLIRCSAAALLEGGSDAVGRLIMGELAHRFGLRPEEGATVEKWMEGTKG